MEYKNQHWITESYLKAWCDPTTPNGAWVWVIAKSGQKISRKSPKSLFSDEDFYTFYDQYGNRNLELEHQLKNIEDKFIALRDKKLQNQVPLTPDDRKTIAIFASTLFARTKRQKDDGKQIWLEYIEMVDDLPTKLSQTIKSTKDYEDVIKVHKNQPMLFHLFQFVNITAPYLFRMNCVVYETKSNQGFITSDNPCIWLDPEIYSPNAPLTFYGIGSKTLNIFLPISPRQYISLERNGPDGYRNLHTDPKTERELIDTINRMTLLNCEEYIVANQNIIKQEWFND